MCIISAGLGRIESRVSGWPTKRIPSHKEIKDELKRLQDIKQILEMVPMVPNCHNQAIMQVEHLEYVLKRWLIK